MTAAEGSVVSDMEWQREIRRRLAVWCARQAAGWIRRLGRGDGMTLPGSIARKIDPDILTELAQMVREKILVTTGTNGKTTTNHLLAHILEAEGKKVVINGTGANMLNGVTAAFVLAAGRGRLDADYACIEVDENASAEVFARLRPDLVLITNLSRDQLDRYGEVDLVCARLKEAMEAAPCAGLIVNADDPAVCSLSLQCRNPVTGYGIEEKITGESSCRGVRESLFCRRCGGRLEYSFFQYGHLGMYRCPSCAFRRPKPRYGARRISFDRDGCSFETEGIRLHCGTQDPCQIYNTLSAYAVLRAAGAPVEGFGEALEDFDYGNGRERVFRIGAARVQLYLAKNPVGFQQKLSLLGRDPASKDMVVEINDGEQDGRDVSWLWDVDFGCLKETGVVRIVTTGTRRDDMGLRLKYEDIPSTAVPAQDLPGVLKELTVRGTGNLYVIVNYSGLYPMRDMLERLETEGEEINETDDRLFIP